MRSKQSSLNRRQFFARSAIAAGAGALGGGLFDALVARSALCRAAAWATGGHPATARSRPAGDDLALPGGFQYRVISNEGDPMDDGFPTPKAMDGMAAFPLPNGNVLLIRNHEDNQAPNTLRPRPAGSTSTSAGILNHRLETHYGPRAFAYDTYAGGGTTTLEVEPHGQRRLVQSALEPGRNAAQLCRRTDAVGKLAELRGNARKQFRDRIRAESRLYLRGADRYGSGNARHSRSRLKHLGRFAHEAVAVDPATGIVYETEDQGDGSGFYRYVPSVETDDGRAISLPRPAPCRC